LWIGLWIRISILLTVPFDERIDLLVAI
jgi:hypothetical protein